MREFRLDNGLQFIEHQSLYKKLCDLLSCIGVKPDNKEKM